MANFFSASQEEQQEILLNFWQTYKYLLIVGLMLVVLVIVGRDYYQSASLEKNLDSATQYQEYIEAENDQSAIGDDILQSYPATIYSDFVLLNEAKKNYLQGQSNIAIDLLKSVIENKQLDSNEFDPILATAQIRLAKIYLEQKNYDEVLNIFESNGDMTSSMHELNGDAHNGLNQFNMARTSFMLALQSSTNQTARALINMKISDLESEEVE